MLSKSLKPWQYVIRAEVNNKEMINEGDINVASTTKVKQDISKKYKKRR